MLLMCEDKHVHMEIVSLIYTLLSLINDLISTAHYFLYITVIVVGYQVARVPLV